MTSTFAYDVGTGMPALGIPEMYHISEAIYEDDMDALKYHMQVAGTVHSLWYGGYQMAKYWELLRHGRSMMPFHTAMSHKGVLIGQIGKAVAPAAVGAAVLGGTIHAIESGDLSYTIPGFVMGSIVDSLFGDMNLKFGTDQQLIYLCIHRVYMGKLYWRIKKNGKWTWRPVKWSEVCYRTAGDFRSITDMEEEE